MARFNLIAAAFTVAATGPIAAIAQPAPPAPLPAPSFGPMTGDALGEIIASIDPDVVAEGPSYRFIFAEREVFVVYDEAADRMRMMTPIAPADGLDAELAFRMLQANFDSALDARYALAQDVIWSVFLHPLGSLTEADFTSGLVQVAVAAETFGTTFSSGAFVFGGGDSSALNEELVRELEEAQRRNRAI